jgi:phosphoglycerol transferase MdoB-like AlkP superfamily enzyme
MNWFQKNFKTIIYVAFLVPILTVAFVSISHVTKWYGLSNPFSWAIYLSVGIEIAALSALAAISAQMGKKVYFPFGIVTLIQFIGNIFFAYQYIDITSQSFKDWVDLVDPIVSYLGVESGDPIGHKRFLALFSGGMLPIISLSFLHMLVKFEEEDKKKQSELPKTEEIDIDALSIEAGKQEALIENEKYNPTEEDLKRLEEELIKLNEQKFGVLEEPTTSEEQINEPEKKILNYLRRDA